MSLARKVSLGYFLETWYLVTFIMSITRASFIIKRGRYHWVYLGFNDPNPCYDQAHGPCLRVLHLVRRGKTLDLSMSLRSIDSVMGNVDPCPREGEGAEDSDRCRVWLSLFVQCSANGRLLGLVSWRAEDVLIPDGPISRLSGKDFRRSRQMVFTS